MCLLAGKGLFKAQLGRTVVSCKRGNAKRQPQTEGSQQWQRSARLNLWDPGSIGIPDEGGQ